MRLVVQEKMAPTDLHLPHHLITTSVLTVHPVLQELLEMPDLRGLPVMPVLLVGQLMVVVEDLLDHLDLPDHLERMVQPENQVNLDHQDSYVKYQVLMGLLDHQVPRDLQDQQDHEVPLESLEPKDHPDNLEMLELMVSQLSNEMKYLLRFKWSARWTWTRRTRRR